jgi:ABC-type Na+ transport system ATPase subunit NatA
LLVNYLCCLDLPHTLKQDDVNVEDHLMLFGRLRGLHGAELRKNVDEMAISLGFPEKRRVRTYECDRWIF